MIIINREAFSVKFDNIKPINKEMSYCSIWIMYSGANRNRSNIPKEVVDQAIPTLYSCPIICEWIESKDDFGSHGGKIVIDNSTGDMEFVRTTYAVGFVPESATIEWKTSPDDEKEYLVVDNAILWSSRFPETMTIAEDGFRPQSMEVDFTKKKFNETTGITDVEEMVFSALCILGEDVEPAFALSRIEIFEHDKAEFYNLIKDQIKEMVEAFSLSKLQGGEPVAKFDTDDKKKIEIDNSKDSAVMDGSWSDVDKTALRNELTNAENAGSLVNEGYLVVDSEWENAPSESLHYPHHVVKNGILVVHKNGLEAAYARLMQNDPHNEKALKHVEKHYKELGLDMSNFNLQRFALSSEQLEGELRMIVSQSETFVDPIWGFTEQRYYYIDSQDDVVIVQDCKLGGLVGFKFTLTGDLVSVNFDTGLRYKNTYEPMDVNGKPDGDENETNATDGDDFTLMPVERMKVIAEQFNKSKEEKEKLLGDEKSYKAQIEEYSVKVENLTKNVEELSQFKLEKEKTETEQKVNGVISKFATHLTEDEIETFKSNANELSVEELETQLYALVGRKLSSENFSLKNDKTLRVPLFTQEGIDKPQKKGLKPYDDLIENYRAVSE